MKATSMSRMMLVAAILAVAAVPAALADGVDKFMKVKPVVNEESGFLLRIDVNHPDRIYRRGDRLEVTVEPEKDAYIYLFYYDVEGGITCLFPNYYDRDNLVEGGREVVIPSKGQGFVIETEPPFGEEVLHVVAVRDETELLSDRFEKLDERNPVASLTQEQVERALGHLEPPKAMRVRPTIDRPGQDGGARPSQDNPPGGDTAQRQGQGDVEPEDWAERHIVITTTDSAIARGKQRRLGVCIGISDYENVRKLRVSHLDARRMRDALDRNCGLDEVTLLTDAEATAEAIRRAIAVDLVRESSPGDTVFIYFSGHGGRCADTNGDEADGFDEYLVPHDGVNNRPETMILDDTFARWMADLDGRRICIVLDTCYSGGAAKGAKALQGTADRAAARALSIDFFDGELRRAKDIGQEETAVIAASRPDQIAWEMPSRDDGSVLTHFFIRALDDPGADRDGDDRLSVPEVFDALQDEVKRYVAQNLMAEQDPVLIDNAEGRIVVRP